MKFFRKISLALTLLVGINGLSLGNTGSLEVNVSLFPIGSFDVTSDKVESSLMKVGDKFTGDEIKVLVESLDTGISLRNRHMRERLHFEKHPHVLVTNIRADRKGGEAKIQISGVSKPIKFEIIKTEPTYIEVKFPLNLADLKIEGINYRGVGVEDEVQVHAKVPYETK